MCRDKEITAMRLSQLSTGSAGVTELRRRQTMELVARALGATQPALVASSLDPQCQNVHQAIVELRQARPEWFGADFTGCASIRAASAAGVNAWGMPCGSID
jgi:hypothetical protein